MQEVWESITLFVASKWQMPPAEATEAELPAVVIKMKPTEAVEAASDQTPLPDVDAAEGDAVVTAEDGKVEPLTVPLHHSNGCGPNASD